MIVVQSKRNPLYSNQGMPSLYIGRGSLWGNPFTGSKDIKNTKAQVQVASREEAVNAYYWYARENPDIMTRIRNGELEGKALTCYCAPLACHGDALILLHNQVHQTNYPFNQWW